MKKLYLLRHAEASHPQGVADHNRPLNQSGIKQCAAMGAYFGESNLIPELVLCSDALRTVNTAKNIFTNIRNIKITTVKKLYNATAREILQQIVQISDKTTSAMIVGHNPGIAQLALILGAESDATTLMAIKNNYPPCALTQLTFACKSWQNLTVGGGRIEKFIE